MSETPVLYTCRRTPPTFEPEGHTYTLNGINLPSVTGILKGVFPVNYYGATEWHMDRGHVVHQCAAMLCQGIEFEHDPQIDGQVKAVKMWLAMIRPEIISVERMVWRSSPIPYAGTLDLLCNIEGTLWIVDWKGSQSPWDQWQLGGYADALAEDGINPKYGMTVKIDESGKPKEGKPIVLRSARNEWRSILNVYQMKQREEL